MRPLEDASADRYNMQARTLGNIQDVFPPYIYSFFTGGYKASRQVIF